MQKFYEDTLIASFLKSFCKNINLPLYDTVADGDIIIEGCFYIIKHYVIKCLNTGTFYYTQQLQRIGQVITLETSSYVVVDYFKFGKYEKNLTEKLLLNSNYYNEDTHIALGRYLRCIRDLYNIDLLGLYNYYVPKSTDLYSLKYNSILNYIELVQEQNKKTKNYIIPIQFNTNYNIKIESSSTIIKAVYVSNIIQDAELLTTMKCPSRFNDPFTICVTCSSKTVYCNQKNLCLFIQVPKQCESSLVIQEDNSNNNTQIGFLNDGENYAFSDKLIQYLSGNITTQRDTIPNNILRVQKLLQFSQPNDLWDYEIKSKVHELYDDKTKFDVTGYIDSEMENQLCHYMDQA